MTPQDPVTEPAVGVHTLIFSPAHLSTDATVKLLEIPAGWSVRPFGGPPVVRPDGLIMAKVEVTKDTIPA